MNITEAIQTLKAQKAFSRTPSGRSVSDFAKESIEASLADEKNFGSDVTKCLNCGIIMSSLLVPDGCVNCGGKDLSYDVSKADLLHLVSGGE